MVAVKNAFATIYTLLVLVPYCHTQIIVDSSMNLAMIIQFSGMLYDNRGCNSADIYLINLLDLDLYITLRNSNM